MIKSKINSSGGNFIIHIIKCPYCGQEQSLENDKCMKCKYDFKNHKPFYADEYPNISHETFLMPIVVKEGLIECPFCGWKQPDKNAQCDFCDRIFPIQLKRKINK